VSAQKLLLLRSGTGHYFLFITGHNFKRQNKTGPWQKKPTLTGGTKRYKSQKKQKNPNKAASRIEDLHEHWLVNNAAAEERTPTAVTLTRKLHLEATHGS
jgi:hypothetical protein